MLTACAPTEQQKADYDAVARSGVSPAIYDKMTHDDPLSFYDIATLSRARVSDGVILRYIRDQHTIYYVSPQDVQYLQKSGVSQSVIDYMVQTAPPGQPYPPPPNSNVSIGVIFGPYWHRWH